MKCAASSLPLSRLICQSFTFWAFDSIGWGLYLNTWSRQSESDRQANFALYTSVWVVISLVSALAVTRSGPFQEVEHLTDVQSSWWFFFKAFHPIKAVQQMHDGQIKGLLRSTASTTDHFSLGFLTNRFSSDLLSYETDYVSTNSSRRRIGLWLICPVDPGFLCLPWHSSRIDCSTDCHLDRNTLRPDHIRRYYPIWSSWVEDIPSDFNSAEVCHTFVVQSSHG